MVFCVSIVIFLIFLFVLLRACIVCPLKCLRRIWVFYTILLCSTFKLQSFLNRRKTEIENIKKKEWNRKCSSFCARAIISTDRTAFLSCLRSLARVLMKINIRRQILFLHLKKRTFFFPSIYFWSEKKGHPNLLNHWCDLQSIQWEWLATSVQWMQYGTENRNFCDKSILFNEVHWSMIGMAHSKNPFNEQNQQQQNKHSKKVRS